MAKKSEMKMAVWRMRFMRLLGMRGYKKVARVWLTTFECFCGHLDTGGVFQL